MQSIINLLFPHISYNNVAIKVLKDQILFKPYCSNINSYLRTKITLSAPTASASLKGFAKFNNFYTWKTSRQISLYINLSRLCSMLISLFTWKWQDYVTGNNVLKAEDESPGSVFRYPTLCLTIRIYFWKLLFSCLYSDR